jgi:hypothetical protein
MTKKIQVQCDTCNKWFDSGIQMDEESFKTATIEDNTETCPLGHVHTYSKEDMKFR